ncbi:histidine utilization repressor [Pseudoroseomonas ludipueritiae]|uniref:Histidine utilization repressor n=1 Tax=Pseudoroseomonas ludipueritiae TaxID=198093 RepID=A0ABR7R1A8_9PROT|nr:histidine utilization repressor [Pseudoroseomonas ludipueritiae]MBC9175438.1 histidine utilization repressor [Pseudoroseomonas ludipueritiae]
MAQPDLDPTAPRYQQIKSFILERVRSGEWSAEHRVPSENELVRLTGHSRVTVGRALRELADAGLLKRVQGVGTFVASGPPQSALLELRDIAGEITERGHVHAMRVEALGRRLADVELAVAFGVPEGSPLFHSRIVHLEDDVPVQLEDRLVNPVIAPDYLDQDFTRTTPYAHLMACAPAERVEHVVEAVRPDAAAIASLGITPDEPCLLIHRRTWSRRLVATRAWLTHPGSRYRLGGALR